MYCDNSLVIPQELLLRGGAGSLTFHQGNIFQTLSKFYFFNGIVRPLPATMKGSFIQVGVLNLR
jgi:hypothetical protein